MGVHDKQYYFDIKRILNIPADEPIFIIRAQDISSVQAILQYKQVASKSGASEEFQAGCLNSVKEFEHWQVTNPNKVKVPD